MSVPMSVEARRAEWALVCALNPSSDTPTWKSAATTSILHRRTVLGPQVTGGHADAASGEKAGAFTLFVPRRGRRPLRPHGEMADALGRVVVGRHLDDIVPIEDLDVWLVGRQFVATAVPCSNDPGAPRRRRSSLCGKGRRAGRVAGAVRLVSGLRFDLGRSPGFERAARQAPVDGRCRQLPGSRSQRGPPYRRCVLLIRREPQVACGPGLKRPVERLGRGKDREAALELEAVVGAAAADPGRTSRTRWTASASVCPSRAGLGKGASGFALRPREKSLGQSDRCRPMGGWSCAVLHLA